MAYFSLLSDYLGLILNRSEARIGIFTGIILVGIEYLTGLSPGWIVRLGLVASGLLVIEAGYGVFREERIMRSDIESKITMTARIGRYAANLPDPGPEGQP